ncbi:hypothetical protein L1987_78181 [Smallanthus sonchifolius]|uniref:Uncharacterized protein n=1 Tax=Smallanthus sonchifolius TaxID=185202 RepID=A0ACB8ZBP1_9ASTR|nr:hypothetical protein L1987_78181 [Smallanthus sonchifolius]
MEVDPQYDIIEFHWRHKRSQIFNTSDHLFRTQGYIRQQRPPVNGYSLTLSPMVDILLLVDSLGIEDTMASMVGYKYGVLLWSKTCSVYCKLMCFYFVCSMVSLDIYTVTRSFSYMSYRLEQEYMSYRLEQEYCFK